MRFSMDTVASAVSILTQRRLPVPPRAVQTTPPKNGMATTSLPTSILDRIRPIEATNTSRLKCSFYGDPGTGKTRLSCTFPKPLLLLATEVGTDSVVGTPGVDVAPVETAKDFYDCLEHAMNGKSQWGVEGKNLKFLGVGKFQGEKYRSVVLDTATKLRKNRIAELFKVQGKEVPRAQPFLYAGKEWKDVWQQCSQDMQKMLAALLDIPRTHEMNVVVNSHEANLTYDDGQASTTSEFLRPNVSSAVGKAVADFLNAEVSYMGQMLIRDVMEEKQVTMGSLTDTVSVKVGTEYVMRVGPDATYRTKFRRSLEVTTPLPDFLVNPTYNSIVKLIRGEQV